MLLLQNSAIIINDKNINNRFLYRTIACNGESYCIKAILSFYKKLNEHIVITKPGRRILRFYKRKRNNSTSRWTIIPGLGINFTIS
jgi:hypothetical protein